MANGIAFYRLQPESELEGLIRGRETDAGRVADASETDYAVSCRSRSGSLSPDCGLKTRMEDESLAKMRNMMKAVRRVRQDLDLE